jgi:hypothetical protein
MPFNLSQKEIDIEDVAEIAQQDKNVFSELLEGILSRNDSIRFNSFKVLLHLSEKHPALLYPQWDYFASLLESKNSYSQYIAIYLIARLTAVDIDSKFELIFDKYWGILEGEGTITAAHLALNSGKIARAKPQLMTRITSRLLNIDKTHRGKQKELVKGHAIEAFDEYYRETENKQEILEFVRRELESKSPRTRKLARQFLEKWDTG